MTRLRQVLINLVGNSIKFTHAGSVTISVERSQEEIVAAPGQDNARRMRLHFVVRDTGIGIPHDKLDRLFKSFSQVDSSTTRQYGGTGLGLAICERLSSLMGGRIWVESDAGKGSAFQFTVQVELPGTLTEACGPVSESRAPAGFDATFATRLPLRILLTDDDAVNRKVGEALLKKMGYQPALARNGAEALTALEQNRFDIVFMDMQMPEMDGLEATRRILERWPNGDRPRIIAMTAEALEGDREKCLAAGMDDYVPKPVRVPDVRAALERWGGKQTSS